MSVKATSIGRTNRPWGSMIGICLAAAAVSLSLQAAPAFANGADSYFDATKINQPGQALPATFSDSGDTSSASWQTDIPGGEPLYCDYDATQYYATVWYQFHPHVAGEVDVWVDQADLSWQWSPVVKVIKYEPATGAWSEGSACGSAGTGAQAYSGTAYVEAGSHWKVQIGGEWGCCTYYYGDYNLYLEFQPDTDGDHVIDKEDACPTEVGPRELKGCPPDTDRDGIRDPQDRCPQVHRLLDGATDRNNNGCPDLQQLKPNITIGGPVWYRLVRGRYVGVGRIVSISAAQLQKGMKLTLRCSRHACKRKSIDMAKVRHGSKATLLKNVRVRKGAKIKISVTRPGIYIGQYIQVRVKTGRNGYPQKTGCIRPGTTKPEACKNINPQV